MANRRMVSKSISVSTQVSVLDDQSALLFTWLIPHADDWGRMTADPGVVKALVVPRRDTFTIDTVRDCLSKMAESGLIALYEHDKEAYLCFPHWDLHQGALAKSRRSGSKFPEPQLLTLYCNELQCSSDNLSEVQCDSTLTQPNLTKLNPTQPNSASAPRGGFGDLCDAWSKLTGQSAYNNNTDIQEAKQTLKEIMPGVSGEAAIADLEKLVRRYYEKNERWPTNMNYVIGAWKRKKPGARE